MEQGDITNIAYSNIDLYEVVSSLDKYVIIINNKYLSWGKDIRFDYRDLLIFLPYFQYDKKAINTDKRHKHLDFDGENTNIHYNFELKLHIFYNYASNYKNFDIYFADIHTLTVYHTNLNDLKFSMQGFSIEELYNRYLNASYFDEAWEDVDFKNNYHWIGIEKNLNIEAGLRSSHALPTWKLGKTKACTDIVKEVFYYTDIRLYDYETLSSIYDFELNTDMLYYKRRYEFEAYLLLGVLEGLDFVETDFQEKYEKLGVTLNYIKYEKEGAFPLFLKHYYTLNSVMKKKTYEHYKRIIDLGCFDD